MRNIQPLTIWKDGSSEDAVYLKLYISYDDLESFCMFQYQLLDVNNYPIAEGNRSITGQEYINWKNSNDSNNEAYQIVATMLNLTLIP
jgi:hypothetical protein